MLYGTRGGNDIKLHIYRAESTRTQKLHILMMSALQRS